MTIVRCTLAVPYDAQVDGDLLDAMADASGKDFVLHTWHRHGIEVRAMLCFDESGDLMIRLQAMHVLAESASTDSSYPSDTEAIRQAVGIRLRSWSEQMVRAHVEAESDGDPHLTMALAMVLCGGFVERRSLDLLQCAAASDDETLRGLAEKGLQWAADVCGPSISRDEEEAREVADVLRPQTPTDGEDWVTARAGVAGRQIPRPVVWLRGSDASKAVDVCRWDYDWFLEVAGDVRSNWYEDIWLTEDERTAVHLIEHTALNESHIAVHGADATAVIAALREAGDLEVLDGPPKHLPMKTP